MLNLLTEDQRTQLDILASLLQTENAKYNLTAITNIEQIRSRHFEDSLIAVEYFEKLSTESSCSKKCVDIGSGAGFPGIVLAIALPDWKFVSIEATGKKIEFQKAAAEKLGLRNFEPVQGRAEELAHQDKYREKFDIATCRAVGHLAIIAELCIPFIAKGGLMLAWKGPKVSDELSLGQKTASKLGSGKISQKTYGQSGNLRLICCTKILGTPLPYPRDFKSIKRELSDT